MSSRYFLVQNRKVQCQHIRHRLRARTTSQEGELYLAVKQYVPLEASPKDGDITIVAAHANGYPKELYEPLWDDLYERSRFARFRIRSIWIADAANQGISGLENEAELGNDPSWFDHARDLLLMVNHFRQDMPRPMVGSGHSMGGIAMAHLALIHPRLLSGLILIDPILKPRPSHDGSDFFNSYLTTFKKDTWSSRSEAERYFRRSPFHRAWDERVFDPFLKYALRSVGAGGKKDGASDNGPVILTTSKHQEALSTARPAYPPSIEQSLAEFRGRRLSTKGGSIGCSGSMDRIVVE